jgi:hypothetical protein
MDFGRRKAANSESDTPIKQSTIHQTCGGFAGAIGPDEMAQGASQSRMLLGNPVNLAEPFDLDQNGGQSNVSTLRENSTRDRSLSKRIDLILLIQIGTLSTAMTQ